MSRALAFVMLALLSGCDYGTYPAEPPHYEAAKSWCKLLGGELERVRFVTVLAAPNVIEAHCTAGMVMRYPAEKVKQ